jgi:CheY-like chemotaxis protein/Tfp pilus assembly protein PilZ
MARRERRVTRRFPLVLSVQIPPGGSAREWTENLSATGLFVRTDRAFTVGERLTLALTFPGVAEDVELEVQVVRRRGVGAEGPAGVAVVVPQDRPASLQRLEELARTARRAETSHQPYRVLLVEDNQLVAAMYGSVLRRLAEKDGFSGLHVEHVVDGSEALARLDRAPAVDVVITDVYMPVMSGFVLLERIRADQKLRDLPVIVISSGSRREQEDAARLGAQYFLRKPVKYQEIVAVVRTLLTAAAHRSTGAP